jgi:hypothetical protein
MVSPFRFAWFRMMTTGAPAGNGRYRAPFRIGGFGVSSHRSFHFQRVAHRRQRGRKHFRTG